MAVNRNTWQYINGTTDKSGLTGGLRWKITNSYEDAIQNNRTIVQFEMWFKKTTGLTTYNGSNCTSYYKYKIGSNSEVTSNITTRYDLGEATTNTIYTLSGSYPFYKVSGTSPINITIPHNADGTPLTVILGSYFNADNSSVSFTNLSCLNKNITSSLPTLERASKLGSIADFSLDDTITIPITKYVSTYTDDLTIKVGDTIIRTEENISDGATITFTTTEKNAIQSLMSTPQITITFELTTLSDSTVIGTSTTTATCSSLSVMPLDSYCKTDDGYYRYAINGLVNPLGLPLQVYDDNGKNMFEDTGWKDFSWTNSTYIGTSQSPYTKNKWRVKNGILYVAVGAGATSTINTSSEVEIARIPITGNTSYTGNDNRVWTGAVGGGGAYGGFYIVQNKDYMSVHLKPHTTANGQTAPWYSTYFALPLDDDCLINI